MQGLFLLPELETTLAIVQKSNEPLRRMVAAPATTLPPFQLRQPSRQRPQLLFLLTTTTHVHTAHLAQMPSDAQPTFLHSTAAYYPERPSPTQHAHMLQLLHALPTLYPCGH
jgi:hypothetical protein